MINITPDRTPKAESPQREPRSDVSGLRIKHIKGYKTMRIKRFPIKKVYFNHGVIYYCPNSNFPLLKGNSNPA